MRLAAGQIGQFAGAQAIVPLRDPSLVACGITWDSREVEAGFCYVALPGQRVDGHAFVADAIAAGAVCVLVQQVPSEEVLQAARVAGAGIYLVSSTPEALRVLAGRYREHLQAKVVGITGSNGKTTTKNLVRDVLASRYAVVATKANQNNELGVPRTLLSANPETEMIVVEMGMRGLGQIEELCAYACPDWGLVTNVGESHIELLGTRRAIAEAKAELFAALPEGGSAFVNIANDMTEALLAASSVAHRGVKLVAFDGSGATPDASWPYAVWAEDICLDSEGRPSFVLCARGFASQGQPERASCKLALLGLHNVSNAVSAAAVGRAAGISLERCAAALGASAPESGRQEVLHSASGITVINDAYNANPDSMQAALETFAALDVSARRYAVLGDMGELGHYAQAGHERVGVLAAKLGLDGLLCVGGLAQIIAQAARSAGMPEKAVFECASADAALAKIKELLVPGDAVLVKASHAMGLDKLAKELVR